MNNPFTLAFGREPKQYISRITETHRIIDDFLSETPVSPIYMITGVRGSGKTVMMTSISKEIQKNDNWYTVELNPKRDLLASLASKIYAFPHMKEKFIKARLDFSAFGFGVSLENSTPVTDMEDAVSRMLEQLKKDGKRLLITIDEVTDTKEIGIFVSSFQIFLRQDLPVYLLMTGLYENIYELQNDSSLTFLYRAPKILLEPLSISAIKKTYLDVFAISEKQAEEMALLTEGYPFAFQVLGYLYWLKGGKGNISDLLGEYDRYLDEYVYEKIWSETSELDKKVLIAIATCDDKRVKVIRNELNMTSELISVYRERLKRKGVINTKEYGKIRFSLPRFSTFVMENGKYLGLI